MNNFKLKRSILEFFKKQNPMYPSKYLASWPCGDINDTFIEYRYQLFYKLYSSRPPKGNKCP